MHFKLKIIKALLFEWQVVDIAALVNKSTYRNWRGAKKSNTEISMQKSLMSNHKGQKPRSGARKGYKSHLWF